MNTTKLKPFAQQARKILMEGVRLRMLFWGFDGKNNDTPEPEAIPGGVIFRNEVYSDTGLVGKWQQMKVRINSHTFEDAIEEAAYTWFNRLMAIKILEKNSYEDTQLGYDGAVPALLSKARNGIMPYLGENEKQKVRDHLLNGDEESAFGLLLTGYCRNHPLLNRVFGGIDDFTELLLPNNLLTKGGIIQLLNVNGFVQEDDYKQVELIGWLYQFYISEKKDEVFKGFKENKKARKEDIPAATQIFTPKWIVKYLVENTVGKTWLDLNPDSEIKAQLKYLVENGSGRTAPLEGVSEASKITLLDPAAGSGHILVTAFDLFMLMYKEEGSTTRQAVRQILKHNLFGLDIDKRAAQLARFAVLMKAASHDKALLSENILPHIYAMPEPVHFSKEHLQKFLYEGYNGPTLDRDGILKDLNKGLLLMRQAQNLGSIIQFDLQDDTRGQLKVRYQFWYEKEEKGQLTIDELSWWKPLAEYLNPLSVLLDQFTCVAANPPYMGQKNMNGELKEFVERFFPLSKADLFAVFMEVAFKLTRNNGRVGMINQHSWMFLTSFARFRKTIIDNSSIEHMLHLGPRTFDEVGGEVVQSTAFVIRCAKPSKDLTACFHRLVDFKNTEFKEKAFLAKTNVFVNVKQFDFNSVPSCPIAYWITQRVVQLYSSSGQISDNSAVISGITTGDNDRNILFWHEINFKLLDLSGGRDNTKRFVPHNKGGGFRRWYGNADYVLRYSEEARNEMFNNKGFRNDGVAYFFKPAISWSKINTYKPSFRYYDSSFNFNTAGLCVFPNKEEDFWYLLGLLNSVVANHFLNLTNPTINIAPNDVKIIPLVVSRDSSIDLLVKENLQICKDDWESNEFSWEFKRSPLINEEPNLAKAFTAWMEHASRMFFRLHSNEEKLNELFISIYGLQMEVTPTVPFGDASILQDDLDFSALGNLNQKTVTHLPFKKAYIIQKFLSYSMGLIFGRYRLDKFGLNIAYPDPVNEELVSYQYNMYQLNIDDDAIIPLFDEGSPFADNVVRRFKDVLIAVWGEETLTENINFLNEALGMSYEKFLIEKFWDYHKKVYQKKPIYWLFSSAGGSFRVLVYMHRMDKFTIQKIRLNYLHKYIEYLANQLEKLKANGATNRTADKLEKALQDCREYDKILKPLADQQISLDLDDGVAVNYAKFKPAVAPIK
jgi:hypothetical protein